MKDYIIILYGYQIPSPPPITLYFNLIKKMTYSQFQNEVYCFLVKYDKEKPYFDRLEDVVKLLSSWQKREYIEITTDLVEEIEKVKEGKSDKYLKQLLNVK